MSNKRRRLMPGDFASLNDYIPGQVACVKISDLTHVAMDAGEVVTQLDTYIPIGVVVIPQSHTDDRKARIISLKVMSCNTPEDGSLSESIISGDNTMLGYNVINPKQLKYVVRAEANYGDLLDMTTGMSSMPMFSRFDSNALPYTINGETWYYHTYNGQFKKLVSPYIRKDLSINPVYRKAGNALADLDGKGNTAALLALVTTNDGTTIDGNNITPGSAPCVVTCSRYKTPGTESGDWWLPSLGEMGYFGTVWKEVAQAMAILYGQGLAVPMENGSGGNIRQLLLWTSTGLSDSLVYRWSPTQGNFSSIPCAASGRGYVDKLGARAFTSF